MNIIPTKTSKNSSRSILIAALISLILICCGKGDELKPARSAIMFIHASPGLPAIDLFIDGNRINGDSMISYTDTIPYKFTNSGPQTFTVKKQISSITYVSKAYILKKDKHYSFFVTGRPDSVTHVITEDELIAPAPGKAKLRFLNMSPDSKSLDFRLVSPAILFTDIPFKCGSDFVAVDPGKYSMGIYEKGGNIALAQQNVDIEAGKFYTVWVRGMKDSPDPAHATSLQMIAVK